MSKPLVVLEKERDFTDIVNGTFSFISQEYKPLLKVILLYAGLPIIAVSIATALYTDSSFSGIFSLFKGNVQPQQPDFVLLLIMYGLMFITAYQISGLVAAYFAEYKEKGHGNFTAADVWSRFMSRIGTFLLVSIVTLLMMIFGFALCIFPGIYLMVPLSLTITILFLEDTDLSQSIDRSFRLISNNWWITFAIILVVGLIVSMVSTIFSVPAFIIIFVQGFLAATKEGSADYQSLPVIISMVIGTVGQYLIYGISYVTIGLQYFNLKEQKDQTSLFKKVSEITND